MFFFFFFYDSAKENLHKTAITIYFRCGNGKGILYDHVCSKKTGLGQMLWKQMLHNISMCHAPHLCWFKSCHPCWRLAAAPMCPQHPHGWYLTADINHPKKLSPMQQTLATGWNATASARSEARLWLCPGRKVVWRTVRLFPSSHLVVHLKNTQQADLKMYGERHRCVSLQINKLNYGQCRTK